MIALILIIIILALIISSVKVVQQSEAFVIERLGSYYQTWSNGIHFKVPLVDNIVNKISLKEHVMDLPAQSVITKDNVSMNIDTVMAIEITDPKLATYGVDNLENALEKSVGTALRNVVGELELDQTLSERDSINIKMQNYMDEITGKWGVKVNRVELKNILPPKDIQQSMERQMKAERERRAQITEAKGNKESQILNAQAEAERAETEARGYANAKIEEARGRAKAEIEESEGKAQAILNIQQAYADSLKMLSAVDVSDATLKLKAFEALKDVANGQATKLIVPSELQDITTLGSALKVSADKNKEE